MSGSKWLKPLSLKCFSHNGGDGGGGLVAHQANRTMEALTAFQVLNSKFTIRAIEGTLTPKPYANSP